MKTDNKLKEKYDLLLPLLNEKQMRIVLAADALYYGHGGITLVSETSGITRATIHNGINELENKSIEKIIDNQRIRKEGGGRKPVKEKDPTLIKDLDGLISPLTRGDPMSPLRWCCKSLRNLSDSLHTMGHKISYRVVGEILKESGYSLQSNRKTDEGGEHPDRDVQFGYINEVATEYIEKQQPVISVDCKKKELIGNFKNTGKEWEPEGEPQKVKVYDFEDKELGKAAPYGVYDLKNNEGWVSVGISSDTAQFAVESIRTWWYQMGQDRYPEAKRLLITADGGGSNGSRNRLWKFEIQKLVNEIGLEISICHFPPGTSKWNKIEHRLFSHISMNWRGKPLYSLEIIVNLIGATKTREGLKVKAVVDKKIYEKGLKISEKDFEQINIERKSFHGEWNYIIRPNNA
jgi:hypothetical protein